MKNLSIKTQVLGLILGSLLVLGIVTTISAVYKSKDALMQSNFSRLTTVRDFKKSQIEEFFRANIATLKIISMSNNVEYLVDDLYRLEEKMELNPSGSFPISDPLVHETIEPYEHFFKTFIKEYKFEDILLINVETGQVRYSAKKLKDYGTNLKTGTFKSSALAEVFRQTIKNDRATYVDMKPYVVNGNAPMLFLGIPVKVEGELNSILVLEIAGSSINHVMQKRIGYGKTQEDYLVGQDHLMRSDSVLDKKHHTILNSFANPKTNTINTQQVNAALKDKNATGEGIFTEYNGKKTLTAYSTIKVGNDLTWAIISTISEDEVLVAPNAIRNFLIIELVIILLLISFIALYVLNHNMIRPLNNFKKTLLEIGNSKDLRKTLECDAPSEIEEMAQSFNTLLHDLQHLINQSKTTSTLNTDKAHNLSSNAHELGENVDVSATLITETNISSKKNSRSPNKQRRNYQSE